jgi:two-component system LytT family response regulator
MRAIIIDDEQKGIDALRILIERFVGDVKVVAESTRPSEGLQLIEDYMPDIVFLDINMPEMNGFELLEKLAWKDFNLVFITAHQEHALKALKNNAMDYLLKPIDYREIKTAIDKIKQKLAEDNTAHQKFNYHGLLELIPQMQRHKIIINSRSGVESVDVNEIVCLESSSNYTTIYLTEKSILASKTLKEFEFQLCVNESNFMRVHHSYIINLNKVSRFLKMSDQIVMVNEQKVPVSKSRKGALFSWMGV